MARLTGVCRNVTMKGARARTYAREKDILLYSIMSWTRRTKTKRFNKPACDTGLVLLYVTDDVEWILACKLPRFRTVRWNQLAARVEMEIAD